MNQPRLTLLETQHRKLVDYLEGHENAHERGAIVLFRRFHIPLSGLNDSDRYIAQEVIPFDASWVRSSSPTHFDFKLQGLRNLFRRCEEEKLVFGFVHNHPTGQDLFSPIDDENERTLTTAIRNRNGKDVTFIAMLWAGEGWHARVRGGEYPETAIPVRHTIVTSQPLKIFGYQCSENAHSEIHSRGAAAFGTAFVDKLKSLRVGIVGNGGTGSPLATLGARAGFGEIVLIDDDELDGSNLRLRWARDSTPRSNHGLLQDTVRNPVSVNMLLRRPLCKASMPTRLCIPFSATLINLNVCFVFRSTDRVRR